MGRIMMNGIQYGTGGRPTAEGVTYDNAESGMTATNVQEAVDELNAGLIQMDLLWTNPNPSASFAAQTISLDLSKYNFLYVTAYSSAPKALATVFIPIGEEGIFYAQANTRHYRNFISSITGVKFLDAYSGNADASVASKNNNTQLPRQIYGIKINVG